MRSVFALSVAAFAGFAAAQIDLSDLPDSINLDDIADAIPSGVDLPSSLPSEIPDGLASLIPSNLQEAPTPTATPTPSGSSSSDNNSLPGLVDQLPRCAFTCLESAASDINCSVTDFSCLCDNAESLGSSLTSCLIGGSSDCTLNDAADAGRVAPRICDRVNDNPDQAEIASASRVVDSVRETSSSDSNSDDDDSGAATFGIGTGLLGTALLMVLAL